MDGSGVETELLMSDVLSSEWERRTGRSRGTFLGLTFDVTWHVHVRSQWSLSRCGVSTAAQ